MAYYIIHHWGGLVQESYMWPLHAMIWMHVIYHRGGSPPYHGIHGQQTHRGSPLYQLSMVNMHTRSYHVPSLPICIHGVTYSTRIDIKINGHSVCIHLDPHPNRQIRLKKSWSKSFISKKIDSVCIIYIFQWSLKVLHPKTQGTSEGTEFL